jgi:HlyD family secretion protein
LTASGTIQVEEIRIAAEMAGRVLDVRARAGEQVRTDDILVVLDATPLLLQLSLAEAAVATARADLALARSGPRAEQIAAAQAALALAEAQRDGALAAWENARVAIENPRELDARIAEARTQVALAEQGAELAEAILASERLLLDQHLEGTTQRRVAEFQVTAAEEALAAAQADQETARRLLYWLRLIRSEPLALAAQANAAEGQHRVAEARVKVAQAQLDDLEAGPSAVEIRVPESAVRQAEAETNVLQVRLNRLTLRSPIDGIVLRRVLTAGELAAPAATILTVADLSKVVLVVHVPENRVGQVRLGQSALVTVDSYPSRTFRGQVTRIGDEPEFTPRNVATAEKRLNTFYSVEIRLPNPERLLKPGMPADADF